MTATSISAICLLGIYIASFFIKQLILKRKNKIKVMTFGAPNKPKKTMATELFVMLASYGFFIVFFLNALLPNVIVFAILINNLAVNIIGNVLMLKGTLFFILSIIAMRTSWRVGIDYQTKTQLITTGIYKLSRNPAFLGFDLLFIGAALAFGSILSISLGLLSVVALHCLILQEEKFLETTFGQEYLDYKCKTRRYF